MVRRLDALKNVMMNINEDLVEVKKDREKVNNLEHDIIKINEKISVMQRDIQNIESMIKGILGLVIVAIVGAVLKLILK